MLKEIEEYNRYDCRSTRRLRDWLMARAIESGVPPRGPVPVSGAADRARRGRRRHGTQTAEVRGRRHRGAHRRADRGRNDGCGQGFSQARGQAVLVGPLRSRQQSRRRMGRRQQRVHRRRPRDRRRLAPAAAGTQTAAAPALDRRDRHGRADPGHVRAVRPALARGTGRRPRPARVRVGDRHRMRRPGGTHPGRHRRTPAQGRRRVQPGAVRPHAGSADQHSTATGFDRRQCGAGGRRAAEPACRRAHRHPAATRAAHPQRRSPAPQR